MSKYKNTALAGPAVRPPTSQAIAGRAYALFLERGGQHGHNLADWLQAERELLAGQDQRRHAGNLPLGLRMLD